MAYIYNDKNFMKKNLQILPVEPSPAFESGSGFTEF